MALTCLHEEKGIHCAVLRPDRIHGRGQSQSRCQPEGVREQAGSEGRDAESKRPAPRLPLSGISAPHPSIACLLREMREGRKAWMEARLLWRPGHVLTGLFLSFLTRG